MISSFFINRPILSWVVALFIILLGIISIPRLEISRFPDIAPPSISVRLNYPGASAYTVETSVAQVIEQQLTGLDNLLYFQTRSSSEGTVQIILSFNPGTDPDIAQMQVQNKIDSVMSKLPEAVQKNGISISKSSDETVSEIAFFSNSKSYKQEDVADFVSSVIVDPLSRVNGVGSVDLRGSGYAVRIWLDESKLYHYKLNPTDIVSAIEAQNKQISVGQIGGLPSASNTPINVNIQSRQMLSSFKDFENIIVKVDSNGGAVYLKDVAKIEMGRDNYVYFGSYNKKPMALVEISLTDGANAIDTAKAVEQKLQDLKSVFPEEVDYAYSYDTTPFIKASLAEVEKTLIEALILVSMVILLFLKSFRSTIIVCITIPIVLSGTLFILSILNYSLNTLTLFAMVLAIGLLVDDAIVVVENINRLMHNGLDAISAAKKSMLEISSALFGVGLVIASVFAPMGFFPGSSGEIYKQFSVSIISAMLLSVLVALIITPSLSAQLLKNQKPIEFLNNNKFLLKLQSFAQKFNNLFFSYVKYFTKKRIYALGILVITTFLTVLLYLFIPSSFIPEDDQGLIRVTIMLPSGSTQSQTQEVAKNVEQYFLDHESKNINGILVSLGAGSSSAKGQSTARMNISLKDFSQRSSSKDSVFNILSRARAYFKNYPNAKVLFSIPGVVRGLGGSSGFQVSIQNAMGVDHTQFLQDVRDIVDKANNDPLLYNVRYEVMDDASQLHISIDDLKAGQYALSSSTINDNLEIAIGGKYVNDFIDRGRIKKVYVQADAKYRTLPNDLSKLYFKNDQGQMVGFDSFASLSWMVGPMQLERFNGLSSITVYGDPASGVSSGEAMDEIAKIITEHPGNYAYSWMGASFQQVQAGQMQYLLYLLSVIAVFLCLAALYESWTIPISVLLILPIGVFGALLFVFLRNMANDVYLQVGLLTTGGLAAKNAILIIEYAQSFRHKGMTLVQAARKATLLRLKPIFMTSIAFLLGVLPLIFATGAGAASQQSIGTGVIGGVLGSTIIGVVLVPAFYVIVNIIFDKKLRQKLF